MTEIICCRNYRKDTPSEIRGSKTKTKLVVSVLICFKFLSVRASVEVQDLHYRNVWLRQQVREVSSLERTIQTTLTSCTSHIVSSQ